MFAYPDYGKAPPEYIVSLTELLASYPETVIWKLADLRSGVASRTTWLPTIADVTKLADQYLEAARQRQAYGQRREVEPEVKTQFDPFPKLTAEFGHEALKGKTFDRLFEASRRLATQGVAASADYLGCPIRVRQG